MPVMRVPMPRPPDCNAALVLADGSVFWGHGLGAAGTAIGEVCFNTAVTGYQEILTDPSYAGQIVGFTFPHIGNVVIGISGADTRRLTRPILDLGPPHGVIAYHPEGHLDIPSLHSQARAWP